MLELYLTKLNFLKRKMLCKIDQKPENIDLWSRTRKLICCSLSISQYITKRRMAQLQRQMYKYYISYLD